MQPLDSGPQVDYTGYVEGQPIQYFPQAGLGYVRAGNCSSIFLPAPTCQRGTFGSPSVWGQGDSKEMPYKLAIGKMINGLPRVKFNIMALPAGQRVGSGGSTLPVTC